MRMLILKEYPKSIVTRGRPDLPRIDSRLQVEFMDSYRYVFTSQEMPKLVLEMWIPIHNLMDGASIPRPLWWFASPRDDWENGAGVHDVFYWLRCVTRLEADTALAKVVREVPHGKFYTGCVEQSVRKFGEKPWLSGDCFEARKEYKQLCYDAGVPYFLDDPSWQAVCVLGDGTDKKSRR
jgi:hypothetical protein